MTLLLDLHSLSGWEGELSFSSSYSLSCFLAFFLLLSLTSCLPFFFSLSFSFSPFLYILSCLFLQTNRRNALWKFTDSLTQIISTRAAVSAFMNPKMVCGSDKYDIGSKDIVCLLRHGWQAFQHAPLQAVAVADVFLWYQQFYSLLSLCSISLFLIVPGRLLKFLLFWSESKYISFLLRCVACYSFICCAICLSNRQ